VIAQKAREAGVDFVLFGGLTLKAGRQKEHFMQWLQGWAARSDRSSLIEAYGKLYAASSQYGEPERTYEQEISRRFARVARAYRLQIRIPQELLHERVPLYLEAALLLAQIHDYLSFQGIRRDAYAYAGAAIQKWAHEQKKPYSRKKDFNYQVIEQAFRELILSNDIQKIPGIGKTIAGMLREFVTTGRIAYYDQLRYWG
ncbi:MAG TPA: hypothetical protein PKL83_06610, partial [bacterium]|nr:hypothetical protein [bacterium]